MKIGFSKKGLTLNSKEFNPLNISVNGFGLETQDLKLPIDIDPFEVLEGLAQARGAEVTQEQKIKILQETLKKFEL
ncbi:MAG: hypothetical protein GXY91_00605 [Clostridia bacterium]|nr:hypothetical protein [Clostridia bacterium]